MTDKHQFNRSWEALPADLDALNLRHAGVLTQTSSWSDTPRIFQEPYEDYLPQRTSKLARSSGIDRTTVEDRQYDSTYAFADTTPDCHTTDIDAWIPLHKLPCV